MAIELLQRRYFEDSGKLFQRPERLSNPVLCLIINVCLMARRCIQNVSIPSLNQEHLNFVEVKFSSGCWGRTWMESGGFGSGKPRAL